ncbi:hypothetical protein EG329_007872 [Mollisiaceae sp. DMI_Dod_QoI]|nr:hypothetical protein EG329_007872 [Helotiales sp. DMI_Dod_QoI]
MTAWNTTDWSGPEWNALMLGSFNDSVDDPIPIEPSWDSYLQEPSMIKAAQDAISAMDESHYISSQQTSGSPRLATDSCTGLAITNKTDFNDTNVVNVEGMIKNGGSAPDRLKCTWQGCGDRSFAKPCELKKHLDRHNKPYICLELSCNAIFGDKAGLQRHEREKHGNIKFRCPLPSCQRSITGFARKRNLDLHIKNRHKRRNGQELEETCAGQDQDNINNEVSMQSENRLDFSHSQTQENTNQFINLGILELQKKLQEREAEREELGLRQVRIEAEIQTLKMALEIFNN